jgi:hypothetical protein
LSLPPRIQYGVNSDGSPAISKAYELLLPASMGTSLPLRRRGRNDIFKGSL